MSEEINVVIRNLLSKKYQGKQFNGTILRLCNYADIAVQKSSLNTLRKGWRGGSVDAGEDQI
ncbi:hypothetical protein [Endozoicomonas acroporae]|uniref:hypothetical protein n=1 Tax=Endozoicomonas acroporae TaxID=1701104 RepID=UPI003D79C66A